jgi:hypothetical protein
LADQSVFRRFHFLPSPASNVVVAEQVQHAVNDVAHQLALPGRVETARLGHRFVQTDKDFTV